MIAIHRGFPKQNTHLSLAFCHNPDSLQSPRTPLRQCILPTPEVTVHIAAKIPDNESARLAALHAYAILDTAPEREFDDLTRLASIICQTPIAVVSFVDADRQWFKSRFGLSAQETARDIAFCAHTILHTTPLHVPSATEDPRFADNPLVTGELGIRFYAGVPLLSPDGYAMGALCVIDRLERHLTAEQIEALEALGRQAITQMELRRTMRAMRSVQERFTLAVTAANTGVWDWSAETNALYLSPQSMSILGFAAQATPLTLEGWHARVHPDDFAAFEAVKAERIADATASTWQAEHRSQHIDGSWRWILTQARIVRSSNGTLVRMAGTHIDLTTQNERERALADATAAADRANRAKSEFLANLSHEIRTPMHGILGMSHLLAESSLSDEQGQYLQGIETSAQSLLTLVNELLDFSKVEAGKMTLEIAHFDLAQMLKELDRQLGVAAAHKGLALRLQLDLPQPAWFVGDAGRLRQILVNLLGNAIKFTERGMVTLRASRVGGSDACPVVRLEVADSGIGIPQAALAGLFEPFSQVDTSSARRFEGTGLGLSICRRLAALMGGQVGMASVLGQGSTFWLELALPTTNLCPAKPGFNPSAATEAFTRLPGVVLVAEDNEINQQIMLARLTKLGLEVDIAVNGREAVAMAQVRAYDLVLMDCQMPEVDGFEATRQLRASPLEHVARVPILAMTASAMPGERERCLRAGMSAYLAKPINERELVTTLNKWLKLSRDPPQPEPDGAVLQVLDRAALDELGGIDTREGSLFIIELIDLFRASSPGQVATMADHAAQGNWPQVAVVAHSMNSGAAYLGALRLSQLCRQIEERCARTPTDDATLRPLVLSVLEAQQDVLAALSAVERELLPAHSATR